MSHEWRPIVGFEGLYEISWPGGKIRSLDRVVPSDVTYGPYEEKFKRNTFVKGRVIRSDRSRVKLTKNGVQRWIYVYLLVKQAFPDKE